RPAPGTDVRVLGIATLPWLPLAAIGGWRTWRAGAGGLAVGLLTVWTAVAYGALLIAAKHSPRYLMLLHPAVALWAAFALAPWLGGRLVPVIGALAGLAWLTVLVWPGSLHPSGTGEAVRALAPAL